MIADRLKEIQEYINYTNQELADRLYISVSLLEKYRAGTRRITPVIGRLLERVYHEMRIENERRTDGEMGI